MKKPAFVDRIETRARQARHALFVRLLATIERPLTILDVGGLADYWRQVGYRELGEVRIVLLNIFPQEGLAPPFSAEVGDARDLSRYADGSFDVVFSNSALGHVGGYADQQRMASEVRRVGQRYFVQTPNHGFPVDWRTLVPGFHFLPVRSQAWCFAHFPVGVYGRAASPEESLYLANRVRNVRRHEIEALFPGAEIIGERFLGFTKSFIAHRGFARPRT